MKHFIFGGLIAFVMLTLLENFGVSLTFRAYAVLYELGVFT